MEPAFFLKLFGPTFARILFAYALQGKINLDFIGSGDIAETLADSLDIEGIVGRLTDDDRQSKREASYIFDTIGDEVAKTVAAIFEADNQTLESGEQEEVVKAAKEAMNRQALSLLVATRFELPQFQQAFRDIKSEKAGWWSEKQIAFYKRVLDASSDYLFAAAEKIPHFTRTTTAQLLKDNTVLLQEMRTGLKNQTLILAQSYGKQQETKHQRFEADYRTQLANALDELRMFGITQLDGARQPLTVAFVKMELAHTALEDAESAQLPVSTLESEKILTNKEGKLKNLYQPDREKTLSVNDAFANHRRLVVVARAGYGKTTLLKWAAVQIARNMPDCDVPLWQGCIPFFVQLRDYIHRELPTIAELPFSLVDKKQVTLLKGSEPDGWAMEQVHGKRAVIFLDGLDEINEKKRQDALHWVESILECEPETVMILSGRPSAIDREKTQPELVQLGFQFVTLKPMDETMTLAFVKQWHEAIAHPNSKYSDKARVPERQSHLLDAFSSRQELQDLAETPLVCAMLCALNLTELKTLPKDRIRLYDRCIELMLTRDEARTIDTSDYGEPLRPDSVKKHLGHIAYWMMENEQSNIQKEDAVKLINSEDLDGSRIVRYLAERSGLLQKQSEDVFDFLHRTFQEFLAAKYIVLRRDAQKVVRLYAEEKLWHETICFMGVSIEPADQQAVLNTLLTKAYKNKEQARFFHTLAWEFWQTLDQATITANSIMEQHVAELCVDNGRILRMAIPSIQKLPSLTALSNLQELDLWGAQVADISPLAALSNLQELNLWGT
ncbi:MAG: NACHT domain-containing protein [Ardenticatenaceae bacterium]|nr:NACHT domain-containing protein [Ardenticatenaceae bacterium]